MSRTESDSLYRQERAGAKVQIAEIYHDVAKAYADYLVQQGALTEVDEKLHQSLRDGVERRYSEAG